MATWNANSLIKRWSDNEVVIGSAAISYVKIEELCGRLSEKYEVGFER